MQVAVHYGSSISSLLHTLELYVYIYIFMFFKLFFILTAHDQLPPPLLGCTCTS